VLSLPMGPHVSDEQVDLVIVAVHAAVDERPAMPVRLSV
jgi:hypothetical protein